MPQFNDYPLVTDPQPEDLLLLFQDSSGAVKTTTVDNLADAVGDIIGSAIGAPTTARYILQQPNGDLSSAQSLSELTTGILKSTTVTGALSIAAAGSDYVAPGIITSSGLTSISGVLLGRNTGGTGAIEALTTLPTSVQDLITRVGTIVSGEWNGDPIDLSSHVTGDLPVEHLDGGTGASSSTFWRGDGTWAAAGGTGTVTSTGALTIAQVIVGNNGVDIKTLPAGTDGYVLSMVAGIPAWAAPSSSITIVGTPIAGQVTEWTSASAIQGVAVTGTGSYVKATSATLVTPALGTPTAIVLTSATGLPLTTGVTGILPAANGGTGVDSSAFTGFGYWSSGVHSAKTAIQADILLDVAAATISASAIDWATAKIFTKTLAANTTFTFSNAVDGETRIVSITNTASNYTVTWPTVIWSGGVAPVQTVGAKTDIYTFVKIGSTIYGSAIQNFS